jgi:hypothetical protein
MAENEQQREQSERMREAVRRKSEDARERAEESRAQAEEHSLLGADRPQDEFSVRAKSSGHGKKTADKWNQ